MPDYKELYLKLFRASEQAINILIAAQRDCEELVLSAPEHVLRLIEPSAEEGRKGADGD